MQTTVQLEKDVAGIRIKMDRDAVAAVDARVEQARKVDALVGEVSMLAGGARDLGLIKKLVIGVAGLVVPSLLGAGVNLIQGAQRLNTIEQRLEVSLEERADLAKEVGQLSSDLRIVAAEIERRREEDQQLTKRLLERLEELETPPRRRR